MLKMKGTKNVKYFDENTEKSIIKLQKEPELRERQRIFVEEIKPAFQKLVENIIFVYKFHTLDEIYVLKNDCISFLFENISKFDGSKGHKAFSYFNVMSKNWFIQKVKTNKKKNSVSVYLDKEVMTQLEESDNYHIVTNYENDILKREFYLFLCEEIKSWRGKLKKDQEKKILESVILLLENPDIVSIYNKKGIYLYLKEITGLNTKQVVTNLLKIKRKYYLFKKKYEERIV